MLISIIIKCLNEEQRIANAITSALNAIEGLNGEVIIADSASTDRTVDIAKGFPVRVVQLSHAKQRCCGIGPQLGYQISQGQYVYVLDGDMELNRDFILESLDVLERDKTLGGVAGQIDEQSTASYQFRGRQRRESKQTQDPKWLDMGGLYRREAIQSVGYLSNRNLHAYEEMDLGLRLTASGWGLKRLQSFSVKHYGWDEQSLTLLKRRWKSRYIDGPGEVLRASVFKPWFLDVAKAQKHVFAGLAIWALLIISVLALTYTVVPMLLSISVLMFFISVRAFRAKSLRDALFGQLVWQVTAIAAVRGFFSSKVAADQAIEYRDLSE